MKKSDKIENAYIAVLAVIIAIIVAILGLNAYSNFQNVESNITVDELAKHESNDIESASSSIGNSVEQSQNNIENDNVVYDEAQTSAENIENNESNVSEENEAESKETSNSTYMVEENNESNLSNESNETSETNASYENIQENEENIIQNTENENVVNTNNQEANEVTFVKPVEGEIIKEFAKDNLVYSETLAEWTTHFGIDIKADKTTVVKASAEGTIKSIKNDPRYGLTIIIEHSNGYQTIYSNLLSSEFVVEGENVAQGQSIGTVGTTATFEFLDDAHLHFELLQNGEYVDPAIYIK